MASCNKILFIEFLRLPYFQNSYDGVQPACTILFASVFYKKVQNFKLKYLQLA